MSFCLNPQCQKPQNQDGAQYCANCGARLRLGDRYRAIQPIAAGGFGRTFLAIDEYKPSKPRCVIKQFHPDAKISSNSSPKASQLFRQEAIQLEQLGQHPQIPDLFATFEQEGRQYLVQEFIDGQNLAEELALLGPFSDSQIRQLLNNLLPVLQYVHDRQVIHRDIKPENIIRRRSDGQLILVDFGSAKAVTGTSLGRSATVIGSAGYAAPEQAIGKPTFASDLYSLGITCIHLMTQIDPFELFDSREGAWVWPDYLVDNPVSDSLRRVLDKMLQQPLSRRYSSVTQVLADLNRPVSAPKPTLPPPKNALSSVEELGQQMTRLQQEKSVRLGVSYLLWMAGFFGVGGLHRFYNGKYVTGVLWFCTWNLFFLGQMVDAFILPGMVNKYEDKMRKKLGISATGVPLAPQNSISQTVNLQTQDQLMIALVRAAQARGGCLSVTQAVMDTNRGFSEVEQALTQMVSAGYVSVENDPVTGVVIYRFNEL
ncbi:protein kinase domain-containing protein [Oscillatoria acuminata]|uniref:non-specific serine/threonine protein kinase n=1 Tax=Oscillatoria acuminata PCC 6304 TaxID=56110 RepID=K9TQ94_9CYAN|nr:protein kinase [Oscillatoria acuminata]AFY85022.1 serine/threonine protein kinase [Oscillatoria acuminata PCC 6304]